MENRLVEARREMVVEQLAHRGIRDPRVLGAMGAVPRHLFVDADLQAVAYEDRPLPIGQGQTISQPYMVARATELAAPGPTDRALEVGAGSGYQAAVLAQLCAEVYAVEILPALAARGAACWPRSARRMSPSSASTPAAAGPPTRPTTSSSSPRARRASRRCWPISWPTAGGW
jgi:hypothetical protein